MSDRTNADQGADTTATTTAEPATTVAEPEAAPEATPDTGGGGGDHLRHIVCVVCYPKFEGTVQAPHDAVCVCGKVVRAGDPPSPRTAPQCVLCDGLWDHHCATAHRRR